MKRFAVAVSAGVLAVVAALAIAWVAVPHSVAAGLLRLNNMSAGLEAKTVSTHMGDIHYLEGGQGETVVLLHGIYARKEHWVDLARGLTGSYRVIALDLPGFGDNAKLPDDFYLLDQQSQTLADVLRALKLENVHIGANSMGAYVGALLAVAEPDLVQSFAFLGSPLGVPTPVASDMDKARAAGIRPLVVQSEADFAQRNAWLSPDIPYVPGPVLDLWRTREVATAAHNARIWDVVHVHSQAPTVTELSASLDIPTLVVWCRPDRIFHVSGAQELAENLPNGQVEVLDGCGHLPMLDKLGVVTDLYLSFLQGVE